MHYSHTYIHTRDHLLKMKSVDISSDHTWKMANYLPNSPPNKFILCDILTPLNVSDVEEYIQTHNILIL